MSELDRDDTMQDNPVERAKNFSRPLSAPAAAGKLASEEPQQTQLSQQPGMETQAFTERSVSFSSITYKTAADELTPEAQEGKLAPKLTT